MNIPRIYKIIFSAILAVMVLFAIIPDDVAAVDKVVLFDEGHGQRFLTGQKGPLDLSDLSLFFEGVGTKVDVNTGPLTEAKLAGVNAVVISGAFKPFTPTEIRVITDFISQGGRLCVMLHIGFPVAELLKELNIVVSNGVVHEQENLIQQKDIDFYVSAAGKHELVAGLKKFKVLGGWALMSENGSAMQIAKTSENAWVDLNRNNNRDANEKPQSFSLALAGRLGKGEFVVFGDDAIFQNRFLTEGNVQLGRNLALWLTKGNPIQAKEKALL